jgi:hypothetical protein
VTPSTGRNNRRCSASAIAIFVPVSTGKKQSRVCSVIYEAGPAVLDLLLKKVQIYAAIFFSLINKRRSQGGQCQTRLGDEAAPPSFCISVRLKRSGLMRRKKL